MEINEHQIKFNENHYKPMKIIKNNKINENQCKSTKSNEKQ